MVVQSHTPMPRIFLLRQLWQELLKDGIDTTASHPDSWDLLADLVFASQPKVIVEAGTYLGHGACAMAEALRFRQIPGHVYTCDVEDHNARSLFERAGLSHLITFTVEPFEKMVERIPVVDFAFIDASSKDNPSLRIDHINQLIPKLSDRAFVIVDDATNDEWPGAAILRKSCNVYLTTGHGMAIFQRRIQ